jgi:hypothetical protein
MSWPHSQCSVALPFSLQETTQAHLHILLFIFLSLGWLIAPLAHVTSHTDVNPRLKQFMDDFLVVTPEILHLVDQNFVVKRLNSSLQHRCVGYQFPREAAKFAYVDLVATIHKSLLTVRLRNLLMAIIL